MTATKGPVAQAAQRAALAKDRGGRSFSKHLLQAPDLGPRGTGGQRAGDDGDQVAGVIELFQKILGSGADRLHRMAQIAMAGQQDHRQIKGQRLDRLKKRRLSQSERLEAMVGAHTADLAREIEARAQAQADLRATQEHLIHAEKMAALGRMSTAIVHEISQPLAAMEATLTSAELSLPPGESSIASRLATARGLIRRMQRTVLNHVSGTGGGIVAVYQRHDYADEKRAALDAWARFVTRLADREPG